MKKRYLFNWDKITGDEGAIFLSFIEQYLGIDMGETVKIEKTDDNKTINVSTDKNFLSFELIPEQNKVIIKIDANRTCELISVKENGNQNIYQEDRQKAYEPEEKQKKPVSGKNITFILMGLIILISSMVITSYALFAGNHDLYLNKTTAQDFCVKCHSDKVSILAHSTNVHKNAGCICHGYNPNVSELYNINVAHNLTKNIYCTNCHTNYNTTTGNILIRSATIAAPNQSAHYLINNSNKNLIYQNARQFFNNSKR